ncbi:MAG: S-layer homology domain-containing protein [Negativicutes bacterium]|nr:S-layer homology domain-containing protein [Negativicutes bacterium]
MKKTLVILLALIMVLSITGIAFAGPFTDVPSGHWSYEAISKLAKAGIVDGYGDGTFRGDKTMTRYEMAMVVGKAMERSDKADAQNKALIEKLAAEYATELNTLGVRVGKLEDYNKTTMRVGFDSLTIISADSPPAGQPKVKGNDEFHMRNRLYFSGNLNPTMTYTVRAATGVNFYGANSTSSAAFIDVGYMETSNFLGFDQVRYGRMSTFEQGAMVLFRDGGNDGIRLTKKLGNDATLRLGAYVASPDPTTNAGDSQDIQYISLQQKLSPVTTVGAAFLNNNRFMTPALPFNYGYNSSKLCDLYASTKTGKWTLTGEYSVNRLSDPTGNVSASPRAWEVQLTNGTNMPNTFYPAQRIYADMNKPGSDAFAVSYRYAQTGAIPTSLGAARHLWWVSPSYRLNGGAYDGVDNAKVLYIGYQYVLAKGLGLSLDYQNFKETSTGAPIDKTFYAVLWFVF